MADPATAGDFTEAQVEKLQQLVAGVVNQAIAARDKQADKKRQADIDTIKQEFTKALEGVKPVPAEPTDGKDGKNKGGDKESVALQTLQRQLEEQRARSDAFEAKANAERTQRRQVALSQTVSQALGVHGIEGNRARAALALLKNDSRIGFETDDEDNIVFRGEDGLSVSLDVGLRQWAKSEEARVFLPPSNTRGSGSRPNGQSPGSSLSKEEATGMFWESVGNSIRSAG